MAPKNWDNEDEERRPDPHDSALSVGSNSLQDQAKMRELEDELHEMTDKVASACTQLPANSKTIPKLTDIRSTTIRRL